MELLGSPVIARWAGCSLPVLLGGAGGYLYYKFIGCKTGGVSDHKQSVDQHSVRSSDRVHDGASVIDTKVDRQ
jgi:hypothetical protein